MGVPGLWKCLDPAAQVRSFTELAVVEGFDRNRGGCRGFRLGIDASIWFFHAAAVTEGENPQLRTIFFRCAGLLRAPFLPLFVFDGDLRPTVKRGKKVCLHQHKLISGIKRLVEMFGFEWRVAPGEAEAELAYLNRVGVLDGILSDDVDSFLFGAETVVRNPSPALSGNRTFPVLNSDGRSDRNHTRVYRIQDIIGHKDVSLTRGDMILFGLCSGGDYDTTGIPGCGTRLAQALVRYGFGWSLYEGCIRLQREDLAGFLEGWREKVRYELCVDSKGYIGAKRRAVASAIPDGFPDVDILLSYIRPATTESVQVVNKKGSFSPASDPDVGALARICEGYFGWGSDVVLKRFSSVMWPGIVIRILRRLVLEREGECFRCGSCDDDVLLELQVVRNHFSSLRVLHEEDVGVFHSITRWRKHAFTDEILEYRLRFSPHQLVRLAELGLRVIRNKGSIILPGVVEPMGPKPAQDLLVWVPAAMLRLAVPRLVEEFERREHGKLRRRRRVE